jgi:catechol 2,3-dioxygenase-like lactoylglutathione lyase family enzyme
MLNHVAILVRSVERSARVLKGLGFETGPREEFEGEGTAEIYVGPDSRSAKLLLLEPIKPDAPYGRAMSKRGPGLHHIALDVKDVESFVAGLAASGWYLHPKSLQTVRKTKTAWLARPGTAMLVEVQQRPEIPAAAPFITKLEIPLTAKEREMIAALGVQPLQPSADGRSWLEIDGSRLALSSLE